MWCTGLVEAGTRGILLDGPHIPVQHAAGVHRLRLAVVSRNANRYLVGAHRIEHVMAAGLEVGLVAAHVDHTDRVVVDLGSLVVPLHIGSAAAGSSECVVLGAHKGSAVRV